MDAPSLLTCGIVWRKTADSEAGWELVAALESADPQLRLLALTLLVESGQDVMGLLESALTMGAVGPQAAARCMAEMLRLAHDRQGAGLSAETYDPGALAC